jgi:DNA-binding CsgD family transcriptional regulator
MAPSRSQRVIGRDAELSRVNSWIQDLRMGHGRSVLVEGEAGIGKTALVRHARDRATDQGCQVLWGAGDELTTPLLLSPLLEALAAGPAAEDERRGAILGLLSGATAARSSDELVTAVGEQIIAVVGDLAFATPTLVVLEDLQWCDPATLAVWGRLTRVAKELPLLLVGTLRVPPRDGPVLALERTVGPGGRMRLGPLGEAPVAQLVTEMCGGEPDQKLLGLAAGAGGNPLYLTELLDTLDRSGGLCTTKSGRIGVVRGRAPRSLTAAIAARLRDLPDDVRQLLRMAALLGAEFSATDLAAVSGRSPEQLVVELDEARDAGILSDGGEPAFRHPMLRQALYEDLPPELRAAWHRDAAAALAGAGAAPERVARQLLPSLPAEDDPMTPVGPVGAPDLPAWVSTWLVESVPGLLTRSPQTTVRLLTAVLHQSPEAPMRDALAAQLAAALFWTGAPAEAEQVALRHLRLSPGPDAAVELICTVAQCHATTGRARETLPLITGVLRRTDLTDTHRARLLAVRARLHSLLNKVTTARRIAEEALAVAESTGDAWAIGWSLHVLSVIAIIRGEVGSSLPLFERALAVAEHDPALTDLRLLLHINHAVALGNLDRYDEAIAAARHTRELTDRAGSSMRGAMVHSVLGELLWDTGRWDDALLAASAVSDDDLKDPTRACCDLGISAAVSLYRGDADAAAAYLRAAKQPAELLGGRVIKVYTLACAAEAEAAGEPERALEILVAGLTDGGEDIEEIVGVLPDAVRIALELGEIDRAKSVTAQVERHAARAETPHLSADAKYCRGLVDGDATLLLMAEDGYEESGRVLARASAARAAGEALAAGGNRPGARAAFLRALAVYEALEADWLIAGLRAQMRQNGVRLGPQARHRKTQHGWEGLTPSEMKVVDLVVQGLSNSQIAADLFLSPRTVETHVSHVLAKLGLRSRVDIVREAGRRVAAGAG